MNYSQFIREIKNGMTKPFYCFYGEDDYFLTEGLKVLKATYLAADGEVFLYRDLAIPDLLEKARARDMFTTRKVVVFKTAAFLTDKNVTNVEMLFKYLQHPPVDSCLVVFAYKIDKRRKIFKHLLKERMLYDFSLFKGRQLLQWTKEKVNLLEKDISHETAEMLLRWTGENMSLIARELEKISLYLGEEKEIRPEVLRLLVKRSFNVSIFQLVDLLGASGREEGLNILKEMLGQGEPPLKILFMISRQLQLLYQTKEFLEKGLPTKELSRQLAVPPFVATKLIRQVRKFTTPALLQALQSAEKTDYAIKTGQTPPALALELLVLKI